MNSSKEEKILLNLQDSLKNENFEQGGKLLEELVAYRSNIDNKRKSIIQKATLVTTCLFIFTISYNVFQRDFHVTTPQEPIQKPERVINLPDKIRVRLKDFWIEIDKHDGSYQRIFIDSTIASY